MNTIFHELLDECVVVFLDDILVYSKNIVAHEKHLREILVKLKKFHFYAKLKKCEFFKSFTTFLGHTVSGDGLNIDNSKMSSIKAWPVPKNKHDV
jgi:Reverse transcriptase (RNA-dependent DNA polymerase)